MNIDHLKDKFDLNELEVSLLEYIKKNQKQLKNKTPVNVQPATLIIMLLLKNTKTIYLILFNY